MIALLGGGAFTKMALFTVMCQLLTSLTSVANGFCDFNVTEDPTRGTYVWLETAETNTSISLECVFDGPGVAVRFCNQSLREWESPNLDDCNTEVTQGFLEIADVSHESYSLRISIIMFISSRL